VSTPLLSWRRISATGNQQAISMAGIVLPFSQTNGASAMDNLGQPRIRSSVNDDVSAHIMSCLACGDLLQLTSCLRGVLLLFSFFQ
jgi:hypothetical protein